MRAIAHVAVGLLFTASLAATVPAIADDVATPPVPPAEAVAAGGKITKSRSNIQNNREAAPAESDTPAAGSEEAVNLLKTKTKSNQSND